MNRAIRHMCHSQREVGLLNSLIATTSSPPNTRAKCKKRKDDPCFQLGLYTRGLYRSEPSIICSTVARSCSLTCNELPSAPDLGLGSSPRRATRCCRGTSSVRWRCSCCSPANPLVVSMCGRGRAETIVDTPLCVFAHACLFVE